MKISILTTITRPDERQDFWHEALENYISIADEVVVVDGTPNTKGRVASPLIKYVDLPWEDEWNWIELPRHLNAGLKECTGDWVIKLDIDQLIGYSYDLHHFLSHVSSDIDVVTFQKKTLLPRGKYYEKGATNICFRRRNYIEIGNNLDVKDNDLCFPIKVVSYNNYYGYALPTGNSLPSVRSHFDYWNFDYFFKTQEFTRKEFFRFSRAFQRYFGTWTFGSTEDAAFAKFIKNMKSRYDKAPYGVNVNKLPYVIATKYLNLNDSQFGKNAWGLF